MHRAKTGPLTRQGITPQDRPTAISDNSENRWLAAVWWRGTVFPARIPVG